MRRPSASWFARSALASLPLALLALTPDGAEAVPPRATPVRADGPALLRQLGSGGTAFFAPTSGAPSALVALPAGVPAETLGLEPVSAGIGRIRGSREKLLGFAEAHPALALEIAPPLHLLNDRVGEIVRARQAQAAGVTGTGVYVGIADTGLDTQHQDFLDESGKSRVGWVLDLSQPPAGLHPEVEAKFSVYVESTNQRFGAVYTGADLDVLHAQGLFGSTDTVGHGTHVAGIAAGDGGDPSARTKYAGVAPNAGLLIVRLTRGSSYAIENDDLVRAVGFMFDRAAADERPCVVNLSLGSDFGPHDGTSLWEKALLATVGPEHPGRVIVAAAGNSGAAPVLPIHQSVHVNASTPTVVPIDSGDEGGSVSVWINFRNASGMKVGLRGPDETWIEPQSEGRSAGRNRAGTTESYNAAVVNGATAQDSPIQAGSQAAVVGWQGTWPTGRYEIVLEGSGDAELYLQAVGAKAGRQALFYGGSREGTINLPADAATMLSVGATVNRPGWTSNAGQPIRVRAPRFDAAGDLATDQATELGEGDVAYFSSAGPNALGIPKPEIVAPGAVIASALSGAAPPSSPVSIFHGARCPVDTKTGLRDEACMLVDDTHGISSGTSMSAPVVAGAVALLLERDPTLTQSQAIALVQAGAHPHRGAAPYAAQNGPGELDVLGSLTALARMHDPVEAWPARDTSWISLGNDHWSADGKTPMVALLELRNQAGEPADLFDPSRLTAEVSVDGAALDAPPIERLAPGLYRFRALAPTGQGGKLATFRARFDGVDVVAPKRVPIALDGWSARYATTLGGGCEVHASGEGSAGTYALAVATLIALRRSRRPRRAARS